MRPCKQLKAITLHQAGRLANEAKQLRKPAKAYETSVGSEAERADRLNVVQKFVS